jgi:energy-coupling factor transport system substrate-specific component
MAMALLMLASGNVFGIVGSVIAAVVATNVIAFGGYCLPLYSAAQEYMSKAAERFNLSQEMIDAYTKHLNWYTFGIFIAVNIVTALVGALIGVKILNKHFRKAGLIK